MPSPLTLPLSLALRGWGRVHPNPVVGAVVMRGNEVISEGWHAEFGGPHAERMALDAAGDRARGATLVVTLEPCAHTGKQPPCVDRILQAGIARVIIGLRDPNPDAGGGAELLRAAGVEVDVVTGEDAAAVEAQLAHFTHRFRNVERPFVALKLATSLDFKIADRDRVSRWISGPAAREWVHWLRAGFDAIGVGGATVAADDPSLTVRGPVVPRVAPQRVIFSRTGQVDPECRLLATAREVPTWVVTGLEPPSALVRALEESGGHLVAAATLADGLRRLREAGITTLLVEGGGRLAGALLAADLVDRFHWIQSPLFLGDAAVPAIAGLPPVPLAAAPRSTVTQRLALGPDTLLTLDRVVTPG